VSNSVPLFKDLGKKFNDLINKDFPSDVKIEIKQTANETLKYEASISEVKGAYQGSFAPKFHLKDYNCEINFDLKTDNKFSVELLTNASPYLEGLKLKFKGENDYSATINADFKHEGLSASGQFQTGKEKKKM